MSRIVYNDFDGEDFGFAEGRWLAHMKSACMGRPGQKVFGELEAVLAAMPDKRLIEGSLTNPDGEVCALGALARNRGMDLSAVFAETDEEVQMWAARELGLTETLAWVIMEENDEELETATPERRHAAMLAWVQGWQRAPARMFAEYKSSHLP